MQVHGLAYFLQDAWFQAGQLARCIGGVPAVHKGCVPAPRQSHLQILLSHLECCVVSVFLPETCSKENFTKSQAAKLVETVRFLI